MTTYVAVSMDTTDRQIYAGPIVEPLPQTPTNRAWLEEYRANAAGYFYPQSYKVEEWAGQAVQVADQNRRTNAQLIDAALRKQLTRSNNLLASLPENPTLTAAQITATLIRHERGLNLLIRAMIELFDQAPPEAATKDTA